MKASTVKKQAVKAARNKALDELAIKADKIMNKAAKKLADNDRQEARAIKKLEAIVEKDKEVTVVPVVEVIDMGPVVQLAQVLIEAHNEEKCMKEDEVNFLEEYLKKNPLNTLQIRAIANSAKVELSQGMNRADIKLSWLSPEAIEAISRINLAVCTGFDDHNNPIFKGWRKEMTHLEKCFLLAATNAKRSFWGARIDGLINNKDYAINAVVVVDYVDANGKQNKTIDLKDQLFVPVANYRFPIKEEHALDGFFRTSFVDSINFIHVETKDSWLCFENPKKACARQGRLVDGIDAVPYGNATLVLLDDCDASIAPWFVMGSCYVRRNWIRTRGVSRVIADLGLKAVTHPMPLWMEESVADIEGNVIVAAKSAWKSGYNGVVGDYCKKNGLPFSFATSLTDDGAMEIVKSNYSQVILDQLGLATIVPDVAIKLTNLYTAYGWMEKEEELDQETIDEAAALDVAVDDIKKTKAHAFILDSIRMNPDFNVVAYLKAEAEAGNIRKRKGYVSVKAMEAATVLTSYGETMANEFINKLIKNTVLRHPELYKRQLGLNKSVSIDGKGIALLISQWFNGLINPGCFDKDVFGNSTRTSLATPEEALRKIDLVINGDGIWPGLLSPESKKVTIDGFSMYVPGGDVMKSYINKEEGSDRMFFSGPANDFFKLLITLKNSNANMMQKYVYHHMSMQKDLCGGHLDHFSVKGGHYVMMAGPWLKMHEVCVLNKSLAYLPKNLNLKNGERVTSSKMPVVMDNAVHDLILKNFLPRELFGEATEEDILSMGSCVWSAPEADLLHANDTDGDLKRLMELGGVLPLLSGMTDNMKPWVKAYTNGEYDLKMSFKLYKEYSSNDLSLAVFESKDNKEYVAKAANDIFFWRHIMSLFNKAHSGEMTEYVRVRVMNYVAGFQDQVMKAIKHSGESDKYDFFECSMGNMLSAKQEARELFWINIGLLNKEFDNADWSKEDRLFMRFVQKGCFIPNEKGGIYSPIKARRAAKTKQIDFGICALEEDMKVLDLFTRSFAKNAYKAAPNAAILSKETVKAYIKRYMLAGQDMSHVLNNGTAHSMLLRAIKEKLIKDDEKKAAEITEECNEDSSSSEEGSFEPINTATTNTYEIIRDGKQYKVITCTKESAIKQAGLVRQMKPGSVIKLREIKS